MPIQLAILMSACAALVFTAASLPAAAQASNQAPAKAKTTVSKAPAPATAKKAAPSKGSPTTTASKASPAARRGAPVRRSTTSGGGSRTAVYSRSNSRNSKSTAARNRGGGSSRSQSYWQSRPSPDRYREIQQALADKGFFKGEVNGTWSADSVEALKNFQRAQNLDPDGKLGSLSLIALGLGPKRITAASMLAPPPPPPTPPSTPPADPNNKP